MGVGFHDLSSIISLRDGGYLPQRGKVVEIGAQQIANSALEAPLIDRFGGAFGVARPPPSFHLQDGGVGDGGLAILSTSAPPFRALWDWVDWQYAAIDVDGSEGSLPLDLNFDGVPDEFKRRYDLVTNYGSTEHIANQYNAFKVVHELCAVGGVMTHFLPSMGLLNHGLVSYNPKFFWMLCRSNAYENILIELSSSPSDSAYPYPANSGYTLTWTNEEYQRRGVGDVFHVRDLMIRVCFRKLVDAPFVAPLDVPVGTEAVDDKMRDRYWTLFGGTPLPD